MAASLPEILTRLYGAERAVRVSQSYEDMWNRNPEALADLAVFCNASAPIQGATEFDRGVEEGKRRVWLHIAHIAQLDPKDFTALIIGKGASI